MLDFLKRHKYLITAALTAMLFVSSAVYMIGENKEYVKSMKEYEILLSYNPLEDLSLEGKAAYIYSPDEEKVFYSKNFKESLPIASITKVMTVLVALENLPATETVTITPVSLFVEGESGLYPYEVWGLRDLADFTLIVSSNDGADALSRAVEKFYLKTGRQVNFVDLMNAKASELGMEKTVFHNPTGLDLDLARAGAYSSAEDVARLFEYTLKNHPSFLDSTAFSSKAFTSYSGYRHQADNTNVLAESLPNLSASKTGFTDLAGGNLAVVVEVEDISFIMTVLGSSLDGRFSDIVSLYQATLSLEEYQKARSKLEREIAEIIENA